MSRFRAIAISAAAAVTLGLVTWTAGAATAGETPTPGPVVTTPAPVPTYFHPVRAREWRFDASNTDIAGTLLNQVEGRGAITMHLFTETRLTPNLVRFALGPNSVTIWHQRLALPVVNPRTCTATLDSDIAFRIVASTGIFAGLRSRNGEIQLNALLSVPQVRKLYRHAQVCPLLFVNLFQLRDAIAGNQVAFLNPTLASVNYQGRADVFRLRVPYPVPTQTYYTPAA